MGGWWVGKKCSRRHWSILRFVFVAPSNNFVGTYYRGNVITTRITVRWFCVRGWRGVDDGLPRSAATIGSCGRTAARGVLRVRVARTSVTFADNPSRWLLRFSVTSFHRSRSAVVPTVVQSFRQASIVVPVRLPRYRSSQRHYSTAPIPAACWTVGVSTSVDDDADASPLEKNGFLHVEQQQVSSRLTIHFRSDRSIVAASVANAAATIDRWPYGNGRPQLWFPLSKFWWCVCVLECVLKEPNNFELCMCCPR